MPSPHPFFARDRRGRGQQLPAAASGDTKSFFISIPFLSRLSENPSLLGQQERLRSS